MTGSLRDAALALALGLAITATYVLAGTLAQVALSLAITFLLVASFLVVGDDADFARLRHRAAAAIVGDGPWSGARSGSGGVRDGVDVGSAAGPAPDRARGPGIDPEADRSSNRRAGPDSPSDPDLAALQERYVSGAITEREFERRLEDLLARDGPVGNRPRDPGGDRPDPGDDPSGNRDRPTDRDPGRRRERT